MLADVDNYIYIGKEERKKFRCVRCGKCCSSLVVGPISSDDMARIIEKDSSLIKYFKQYIKYFEKRDLLISAKIITNKEGNAGGCAFYDHANRSCTIYSIRPEICRKFPFMPNSLVWKECEGIKLIKSRRLRRNDSGFGRYAGKRKNNIGKNA